MVYTTIYQCAIKDSFHKSGHILGSDIVASWVGTCQFRLTLGVLGKVVVV